MKKTILISFIITILIILCAYVYLHRDLGRVLDKSRTVFIDKTDNGFQLYRNGEPFYIKGASGAGYFKEMAEAGGNTLRVYDTLNLQSILDEAEKYNLAIIVDIPMPSSAHNSTFYSDEGNILNVKRDIRKLIKRYKNHPSLLIWNLGNELNFPLSIQKNNFIRVFNDLVDLIHEEDPNHLISTTISGTSRGQTLGIHLNATKLDLIGFNVFSIISNVQPMMEKVGLIVEPLPYYMSEWGNDGPWEVPVNSWKAILEPTSTLKAKSYRKYYLSSIKPDLNCLGSLAFYWGYKHEGTPTWFNIFDAEGRKSEMYYELKSLWTENPVTHTNLPKIEKILLNKTESTNQIFVSGQELNVEVRMQNPTNSSGTFNWRLYNETWGRHHFIWRPAIDSLQIPYSNSKLSNKIKFKVPKKEGPYRVFISVHGLEGNFATANMPFYVLNPEE